MTRSAHITFPELTTEKLLLRQLADSDIQILTALRSDEKVNRYIKRNKYTDADETAAFISRINTGIHDGTLLYWAICLKEASDLIGTICLWNFSSDRIRAELGYELSPQYHGKGLMKDAVRSVLTYANQELGLKEIEAFTHRNNTASIALLTKFDFQPDLHRKDLENEDNVIYTLRINGALLR